MGRPTGTLTSRRVSVCRTSSSRSSGWPCGRRARNSTRAARCPHRKRVRCPWEACWMSWCTCRLDRSCCWPGRSPCPIHVDPNKNIEIVAKLFLWFYGSNILIYMNKHCKATLWRNRYRINALNNNCCINFYLHMAAVQVNIRLVLRRWWYLTVFPTKKIFF